MSEFHGLGALEWSMNASTYIAVEIAFIAAPTGSLGWAAEGKLVGGGADEREGLALLCDLDGGAGLFVLRVDNDEFEVTVGKPTADGRFLMTEGWPD